MHESLIRAQVVSLLEWGDLWEREALTVPDSDPRLGEVAMLLRRAARKALAIVQQGVEPDPAAPVIFDDRVTIRNAKTEEFVRDG